VSVQRYLFYISQNYSFAILRPVQEIILQAGREVAWFVEGNKVNLNYFRSDEKRLESIDDVIEYNAEANLYPANIVPTFLPGINVAVFHGFDAGKLDKRGHNDHFKIRNCFDLFCTQGPETTSGFQLLQKQHAHFSVRETGWCALDPLFKNEPQKSDEQNTEQRKTILLCSTFSKKLSCAPHLFETVKALSKTGKWQWLVQFHPKMDDEIVQQYKSIENEYLSFIETADVLPLLKKADVMVCDTSSVLIMFLLLNKPVVTFNNISPENYLLDISVPDLLESTIDKAMTRPPELMQHIQQFIQKTHPYDDGLSAQRLINAIDEFMLTKDSLPKKPFNLLRQFKIRKRLNYWKFW